MGENAFLHTAANRATLRAQTIRSIADLHASHHVAVDDLSHRTYRFAFLFEVDSPFASVRLAASLPVSVSCA